MGTYTDEVGHGGDEQPVTGGLALGDGELDGEAVELLDGGAVEVGVADLGADVNGAVGAGAADGGRGQAPDDAEVLPVLNVDGRVQRHRDVVARRGRRGRAQRVDGRRGGGEGEDGC